MRTHQNGTKFFYVDNPRPCELRVLAYSLELRAGLSKADIVVVGSVGLGTPIQNVIGDEP